MKVAIVHDWLTNMGGAERVLLALHDMYPDAPIYTTVYDQRKLDPAFADMDVRTSFIQRLPGARSHYQRYLPLMPTAVEQFDLTGYDLVISSSHACAKGVVTRPDALHVCYCYTPIRYAWDFYHEYLEREGVGRFGRILVAPMMNYMRIWDRAAADRPDVMVAISNFIAQRIRKFYRREAVVIHPPVRAGYFSVSDQVEDYFLIVSRLVAYKRIDLAINAFNELGSPLVVIGDGPQSEELQGRAGPNVKFLGRQPDEVVRDYFQRCRAFVFPGEEDFGITMAEAMAAGRPVLAYGRGGALDIVEDGVTGILFPEQTPAALVQAVRRLEAASFDSSIIRNRAEGFDTAVFQESLRKLIDQHIGRLRQGA